jgi:hypothetical protein
MIPSDDNRTIEELRKAFHKKRKEAAEATPAAKKLKEGHPISPARLKCRADAKGAGKWSHFLDVFFTNLLLRSH